MSKLHWSVFLVFSVLLFSSCKIVTPTFKTIDGYKFERIGTNGLKLGANATFHNPNAIKVRITDIEMNVVLDDKLIGILGEKADVVIDKKKDFTIPLGIMVKPEGTILENLKKLYGIITDKVVELYFVGNIKARVLGIKLNIPVKYRQRIKRSDFSESTKKMQ